MGKTPPRHEGEYWNSDDYKWVSISDMVPDGIVEDTKESVSNYAFINSFKSALIPKGTLIMSFKLTVGRVSILGIDALHNEAIISIKPFIDKERITTDYLFAVLPLISQLGNTKSAIKGETLNSSSLNALLIPVPPIDEQKRIVKVYRQLIPYINKQSLNPT